MSSQRFDDRVPGKNSGFRTRRGRVTRRSWVAATALCLAVVTAAIGPVPQDAIAGILAMSRASGSSLAQEAGPATFRATMDGSQTFHEIVSARYPMWMIMLLAILLLLLWLIYQTWTGWKALIFGK
jgi:type VI protein secretion system component VasF